MGILKQPGSNAVAVASAVRKALANLQKTLPKGMKLEVIFDTTVFINESVNEIAIELGLAVVLTGLVCWIFLGSLSSTMNVLFAIPMSLLGTIAILYFAGFTLNTFTLLGLALFGIGLIGEYVGRTYEQVRGRPRYLIAAVLAPGQEPDPERLRALETTRV